MGDQGGYTMSLTCSAGSVAFRMKRTISFASGGSSKSYRLPNLLSVSVGYLSILHGSRPQRAAFSVQSTWKNETRGRVNAIAGVLGGGAEQFFYSKKLFRYIHDASGENGVDSNRIGKMLLYYKYF